MLIAEDICVNILKVLIPLLLGKTTHLAITHVYLDDLRVSVQEFPVNLNSKSYSVVNSQSQHDQHQ